MKIYRFSPNLSGKAEFGLLAALLIGMGGVATIVWIVIKNHQSSEPVTIAVPKVTKPDKPPPSGVRPAIAPSAALNGAITVADDQKAQAALAHLRSLTSGNLKPRKAVKPPEKEIEEKPPAQLDVDGQVIDWDSAEVRAAKDLLEQYLAAKEWKDKLPLIHQSDRTRPLLEEFYSAQGLADPALAGLISAASIKIGTRAVLTLSYSSNDRLNRVVHTNFWRTPGGLRLDWESFVGFSGKGMGPFRASHCTDPTVFRVLAVRDDYYNFEFTDSKKYLCLRLYSPDGEDYVHGYCPRDSADGRKLVETLGGPVISNPASTSVGGQRLPAKSYFPITVEIAFPEKAQSDRCVRIEKFVSPWWLALDAGKQATAAVKAASPSVSNTQ